MFHPISAYTSVAAAGCRLGPPYSGREGRVPGDAAQQAGHVGDRTTEPPGARCSHLTVRAVTWRSPYFRQSQ